MDIQAAVASFIGVAIAEMGDKTQLLTMAFASKYKAVKVLIGVAIASALSNCMAVALGNLLARYKPIYSWVQLAAALSFLVFGLWTLKDEKDEDAPDSTPRYGAVTTVCMAIFVAELGDKTQLFAVSLSAKYPLSPLSVLAGATLAMVAANSIGLIAGMALQKYLSQKRMKYLSAVVFVVFGLVALFQALTENFSLQTNIALSLVLTAGVLSAFIARILIRRQGL